MRSSSTTGTPVARATRPAVFQTQEVVQCHGGIVEVVGTVQGGWDVDLERLREWYQPGPGSVRPKSPPAAR